MINYITNTSVNISGPRKCTLKAEKIVSAMQRVQTVMEKVKNLDLDIPALLGMRNLSGFVGEVFAASLITEYPGLLVKNPHQDGCPDLLVLDKEGKENWDSLSTRLREKAPFSPFETGGFEVKATCGSVPTPAQCARRGYDKPGLGDQRITLLTSYDWKAHHRETNHLFGLVWDFIDRIPTISAAFYSNKLETGDWGGIIMPTPGGGRTTSVSIMSREGVKTMYNGWVAVINDSSYIRFFDTYNNGRLLQDYIKRMRLSRHATERNT